MNYEINPSSRIPAYLQLYRYLRQDISDGIFPYGTKLPSKRIIADETGLSVITVEHAVDLLCEEGYTETKQRSGCFVIFRKHDFQGSPASFTDTITPSLLSNTTGEFPFSVLSKTIRRVLMDYGEKLLVKAPGTGCPELREEICAYLARSRSINVRSSQVVVGSGAEYLYGLIAQLCRDQNVFALESPSYDKIRKVYEAFGITCDMLPLQSDGIDSTKLRKTSALVLHTTPFNSFPTGISINASKKHEYLDWAKDRHALIIEDNYDSEMTVSSKPEESLFSMTTEENVIYVNTFSKTIAPSIRVGYLVLPERLLGIFSDKLGFYSCTVPVLDQYVLAELLKSGAFERHVNRVRRKKRREIAYADPVIFHKK